MPSSILGALSAKAFIQQHWQKEALLIRNAYPAADQLIDRDDLLAMACAEECEARLVVAHQNDWHCEQGPFTLKRFKSLKGSAWTVLIQAVDQWLPTVAALLDQFQFLPRWRLDDIMISLASDGGGVGPHFDHYDVFLLQASGQRRWKTGQHCDENTPLRAHADMKLLKTFQQKDEHLLQVGDMLYVPAGVAHWGEAVGDNCTTISIGFRAPSKAELMQLALQQLASAPVKHVFYRDTEGSIDQDRFCINHDAIKNAKTLWNNFSNGDIEAALAQALGLQSTEVRYPDHIEPPARRVTEKRLLDKIKGSGELKVRHHAASRFAYHALNKTEAALFVDGEMYLSTLNLAREICHGNISGAQLKHQKKRDLILSLLNQGSLVLG